MIMKYISAITSIFLILSCNSRKLAVNDESVNENQHKDTIVFISMIMRFDSLEGKSNVEVLNIIKKAGTIKKKSSGNIEGGNRLVCIISCENKNVRDSFSIEHPLYKEIEFLDEKNQLTRKSIKLNESEFFVRFQEEDCNVLLIKELLPSVKDKELISITF